MYMYLDSYLTSNILYCRHTSQNTRVRTSLHYTHVTQNNALIL